MNIPFAELLGLRFVTAAEGKSRCELRLQPAHMNSAGVAHGGVPFTLADTGMGAALKTLLASGEHCATIELKINYHRPGTGEMLTCDSQVVHKGRTVATMESKVTADGKLIASCLGTFAITASGPR
ncbi:PaaI family thioesterase [Hydrogenophaga sp.]|uniref:PaaI family thioesterase n=1 Tax=Hydrogenophaga sp. TaxID=1904254 RepID=UPI00271EF9A3|nr:PaaI family thioesterase [Hydrogenophaga sp.]MDO9438604.1 PaaI family thioesterase [Hydrogenophaga sp.]